MFIKPDFNQEWLQEITESLPDTSIIDELKDIASTDHLLESIDKCKKGVDWKYSTQNYTLNTLKKVRKTQKDLNDGTYTLDPTYEFDISERGRNRHIKAHSFGDRVIQRSLNDNVLLPRLSPKLIYNNGASQVGKGLSFSRNMFENDLRNAYHEFGNKGVVLLIDFSKYFDNIVHSVLINQLSEILNEEELKFVKLCIDQFKIDVSYMDDEEYANCMNIIFNSLEYDSISKDKLTREKFMYKSMGIGSQLSQIAGIYYPHDIDNYCKYVLSLKYYGRYMDDIYIILSDTSSVKYVFDNVKIVASNLGIFVNEKKTKVLRITNWIPYLKIVYHITDTGGLIRKIHSSTIRRCIKNLKTYKRLFDSDIFTLRNAQDCYNSWRGSYKKYDSGYDILKLDNLFFNLFHVKHNDTKIYLLGRNT